MFVSISGCHIRGDLQPHLFISLQLHSMKLKPPACVCVCVCVCERERERQRERERDIKTL